MRFELTSSSLVSGVATRLGWSEGQVGTGTVGMVAATLLIVLGLPSVLSQKLPTPIAAPALGVAQPSDPATSPTATVPTWSSAPDLGLPEFSSPIPGPLTTTPSVTSPPPPAPLTPTANVALAVRGFGWASSLSDPGLPAGGVPDDTMPVGARLGELDKMSFLRLSGNAEILTLVEDTSGARELIGAGAVRACVIIDGSWAEEPDQALADAPAIDTDHCVDAVEIDNTWTFDLSAFANRSGQNGFALLPAASAPADFQLTFKPS